MRSLFKHLPGNSVEKKVSRVIYSNIKAGLVKFVNISQIAYSLMVFLSLIIEHGFYVSVHTLETIYFIQRFILLGFLLNTALRLIILNRNLIYIRKHIPDIVLAILILFYIFIPDIIFSTLLKINPGFTPELLTSVYLIITQAIISLQSLIEIIRYSEKILVMDIQPSVIIIFSFIILILFGTALLLLPKVSPGAPLSFIDALFTATSAACVTGLTVVDTSTFFTIQGKIVILFLIQAGGLGIMTLTSFILLFTGNTSQLKEYVTVQSLIGEDSIGKIKRTIISIILFTIIIELFGSLILYLSVSGGSFLSEGERIFFAVFHSISAFCNAGFANLPNNLNNGMIQFNHSALIILMLLIIAGGLGFPVISNLFKFLLHLREITGIKTRLTLHSKLVLITTALLIILGAGCIFLLEYSYQFKSFTLDQKIISSFFYSVTSRTAGFNTLPVENIGIPTMFLIIILMWIGASPASTGGGIKTTTFSIAMLNIYSILSGRNKVEIFKKQIPEHSINKSLSIILLSFVYISLSFFILLLAENFRFEDILFELISAFGTVGLSRGITPNLSPAGKIIIILTMFIGRVGILTFFISIIKRRKELKYNYTSENILIS